MSVWGEKVDGRGNKLTAEQRRRACRMGQLDRSSQRDTDPMYAALMATIRDMFGEDLARCRATGSSNRTKVDPCSRGSTSNLEFQRTTLVEMLLRPPSAVQAANSTPNSAVQPTSTTNRSWPWPSLPLLHDGSVPSASTRRSSWQPTASPKSNWSTPRKSSASITKHANEVAPIPQQLHIAAAREDDLDKAATNLSDASAARLPADMVE